MRTRWVEKSARGVCFNGTNALRASVQVEVWATCDAEAGTVLRAPTEGAGLSAHCRDTFEGRCRVRLSRRGGAVLVEARTKAAALEVGGGPWWTAWEGCAELNHVLRGALSVPFLPALERTLAGFPLAPPGL